MGWSRILGWNLDRITDRKGRAELAESFLEGV